MNAINTNTIMQMRACTPSGISYITDYLAPLHLMTAFYRAHLQEMPVARHDTVPMINRNHISHIRLPACLDDGTVCWSHHRLSHSGRYIYPPVEFSLARKG